MITTDWRARRAHARRAGAAALCACWMAAGCASVEPERDVFVDLRAEAQADPRPLTRRASGPVGEGSLGGGADREPVRGFVRRAQPAEPLAPGTGGAPRSDGSAAAGEGEFTLNFEAADLREVTRAMLEDGLGLTYVFDDSVRGTVTIRTNRPLTRSQILPTLEEILRLNNAALVDVAGVLQVVPRQVAGLSAPILDARAVDARGLSTRVTPLRHVSVEDVRSVIERFAPVSGAVSFDPSRNLVFSIGTTAEQQTIAELIGLLDADAFAGRSFALTPLRNADPTAMADEMAAIFAGARARFIPIERMSAVLTIADDARLLDEALPLLRGLDQGGASESQLYVYPVENRAAAELAQVLGGIFGAPTTVAGGARAGALPGGASVGGASTSGALAPGLTPETTGDADAAAALDQGAGGFGAAGAGSLGADAGAGRDGVFRIAADVASNTIVALADADGARRVQNALRRLDRQSMQVMIQATLAEVTLNDRLEYGVRWFFENGNWNFGFTDAATGAVGAVFPGFNAVFSTSDATAALSALDQITDVRLLSAPTLMVMDNETARLQVGDQVPVQTRSATSVDDANAPIVTETEFRDTGVILTLRPRINANGLVVLTIRQEVSDVVPNTEGGNPTFSQRVVESTVAVDSGDTVAIGGLIRENSTRGRQGIPILSNIPVLGAAFGTTETGADRTELIVLLTPLVVRDQRGARQATDELRQKLGGIYGPPPVYDPLTGPRRRSILETNGALLP